VTVLQSSDYAKKYRETATIIADPGTFQDGAGPRRLDADFLAKNGIEVGAEDEVRICRETWSLAEHVSGTVDPNVFEALGLKRLPESFCPSCLLEGRRGDLAQPNLFFEQLRLVSLDPIDRRTDGRLPQKPPADFGRGLWWWNASRRGSVVRGGERERY